MNATLKSVSHPDLIVIERVMGGAPKLRHGLTHPYGTHSYGTNLKGYHEFRGIGIPPEDIGRPGDIFWDITPPYIVYFHGLEVWEAWNPQASAGSQLLAQHPCVQDRHLWIHGNGLSWLHQATLASSNIDIKQFHSFGDQAQKELAAILGSANANSLSLELPGNRVKHDEEVARRGLLGIAVIPITETSISRPAKRKRVGLSDPSNLYSKESGQLLSAQLESLKEENDRINKMLQDSKQLGEELRTRCSEAQKRNDCLTASLEKAERRMEKMKQSAERKDQELEKLRTLKATVSKMLGEMDVPWPKNS
ncbi:hypothetical protein C8R43DRAFT_114913 [Mycena crocata]|nr:hypothetical protein C8R43DRAFT_114913 [Mycena crocata]